ncbi:MAG: dihydrofolate reductase [Candidatus Methylumidiphilus sp.]
MKLSLIAALAANRCIGVGNRLPWHLPADLKRFRALTWGKPMLMGRKTHESIGRPLPGRLNIVLTAQPDYRAEGCAVAHTLEDALSLAGDAEELMVIGGAALYERCLPQADRLCLTLIGRDFAGDTFFPPPAWDEWQEVSSETVADDPAVDFTYRFVVLDRRR